VPNFCGIYNIWFQNVTIMNNWPGGTNCLETAREHGFKSPQAFSFLIKYLKIETPQAFSFLIQYLKIENKCVKKVLIRGPRPPPKRSATGY
jgi:hypothetical protein